MENSQKLHKNLLFLQQKYRTVSSGLAYPAKTQSAFGFIKWNIACGNILKTAKMAQGSFYFYTCLFIYFGGTWV
jgi:hypothetical protein